MQSIQLLRTNFANWLNGSVNRKIFRAAFTVGMMTLLVKGVGLAKSLVVAHQFGTSDQLDAFYIAWILPSMGISVVAVALNNAFVPTYIKLEEQRDQDGARQLLGNILVCALWLLVACSLLLALVGPAILPKLGSTFQAEKLALTTILFFVLLTILPIKGVSVIWAGVLNSSHRFALAALTPAVVPAASMIALFCTSEEHRIYAFTVGMAIGFLLEAIILAWQIRRFGISLRPRWSGWRPALKQVIEQYGAAVASALLVTNAGLVDQTMAAMLGGGSVAVLNYAATIVETLLLIGAFALGTAVLPYFSRMVAKRDWRALRSTLKVYTRLIFAVAIPVTILIALFSEPIVVLFFKRGAFTSEDAHLVAQVQVMLVLQMPFYILCYMLLKLLASLKKKLVLIIGSALNLCVNIVMNLILLQFFGLKGIALSTSIVYMVSWAFLTVIVYREIGKQELLDDIYMKA
jgi:putative peptidoglycan lipid II flippase